METPSFGRRRRSAVIPVTGKRRLSRAMWVVPRQESVYKPEGSGIAALSTHVGITDDARQKMIQNHHRRVSLEMHVDGKLRVLPPALIGNSVRGSDVLQRPGKGSGPRNLTGRVQGRANVSPSGGAMS